MNVAIEHFLNPINQYLYEDDVSEVCINKPKEIYIEKHGQFERIIDESLTFEHLLALADLVAEYNHKDISRKKPLLSATLPNGERCQFILPPATENGRVGLSIRRPSELNLELRDWLSQGAFKFASQKSATKSNEEKLKSLYREGREGDEEKLCAFIELAIKQKKNIVISGGTSSAKTTFLKSCINQIPKSERLITVEGVREVIVPHDNALHLVANEDDESGETTTMLDLLKACLRLRPDRIFLSELRAKEAYPYLRASISGHPGSLTTLHADTIANAKEQLMFMLSESKELQSASEHRLRSIIDASIDVIVQMERVEGGNRVVRDIYYKESH